LVAIDQYVEAEMQATRLPGVALAIVQGDQIIHLKGFGHADDTGRVVTPQTPFLIASVTKPLTALAVMQLVEVGKLELDAPVQRYLPWFRVEDAAASARITVRHLLTHTSGLPTLTAHADLVLNTALAEAALEQGVRALRTTRLTAAPGARFQYSNDGYATLAVLIQTVSGQAYADYLQHHIYAPLDMHHSFVSKAAAQRDSMALGYRYWFGVPRPYDFAYSSAHLAAGFTIASAEDLAHYLVAQLNGGRYGDTRVLSPDGIAAMHQAAVPTQLGDRGTGQEAYGLGWFVREAQGVQTVAHSGVAPNFHADVVLVPAGKWGVVLLTNGENSLQPARIAGIAHGVTSRLVGTEVPSFGPTNDLKPMLLRLGLLVGACQVGGLIWSLTLLRRWRAHPERRPQGWRRRGVHIVLPLVLNVLWALICLVGLPRFFVWPLWYLRLFVPDLGYVLVLSGAVALAWSILRSVLMVLALRKRTPGQARA